MEGQPSSERSEVDTTRPFRSVKEAVAVFGERILALDTYSQKTNAIVPKRSKPLYSASSSPLSYSSSSRFNQDREDDAVILSSVKKLEDQLAETRREVKLMKERESEMEMAVAYLNTELRAGMSKLAEIEAVKQTEITEEEIMVIKGERWGEEKTGFEYLPTLAEVLRLGDMEDGFGGRRKAKAMKKKPIVPLITDIFAKKKSSADFDNAFYNRPFFSNFS